VACGGRDGRYTDLSSCLSWTPGSPTWSSSYTMRKARCYHLVWTPPTRPGTLLLLGGAGAKTTGEEVPGGATFTLPHRVWDSCGIEDGDTFIATGGDSSYVTRFGPTGAVEEELPRLPQDRSAHGCGLYPTGAGQVRGGGHWPGAAGGRWLHYRDHLQCGDPPTLGHLLDPPLLSP